MFNIECFIEECSKGWSRVVGLPSNRSYFTIRDRFSTAGGKVKESLSWRDRFLFLTGPKPIGASPLPISLASLKPLGLISLMDFHQHRRTTSTSTTNDDGSQDKRKEKK